MPPTARKRAQMLREYTAVFNLPCRDFFLTFHWRWQMRSGPWKRREEEVTFHRNGTLSSSDGSKGEWWFDVGGLYWVCTAQQAPPSVATELG